MIEAQAFESDGYALVDDALTPDQIRAVEIELEKLAGKSAGTRTLLDQVWCQNLARELRSRSCFSPLLTARSLAVQCTYFEKSDKANWLVPFHQDVDIPVLERVVDAPLTGWSEKEGVVHVHPPITVLEQLVAVRVHIDPCNDEHGPLKVIPGSHRVGRLKDDEIPAVRKASAERVCIARRGAALLMRPLLLHASAKAFKPNRRRVLHFLFGPESLPYGLRWCHAV
jgi:hypothetical protein